MKAATLLSPKGPAKQVSVVYRINCDEAQQVKRVFGRISRSNTRYKYELPSLPLHFFPQKNNTISHHTYTPTHLHTHTLKALQSKSGCHQHAAHIHLDLGVSTGTGLCCPYTRYHNRTSNVVLPWLTGEVEVPRGIEQRARTLGKRSASEVWVADKRGKEEHVWLGEKAEKRGVEQPSNIWMGKK